MKNVVAYIVLLLVLCGASFWLGTRQVSIVESTETQVEIDSTLVDTPAPPIEVKPTNNVVVAKLPIVNYDKLKSQIVDSLIAAGYSLKETEVVLPTILPDSAEVDIPMSQSIFKKQGVYEIGVTGYNTSLDYAKIFNTNTTTTLQKPIKHWAVNANANSFTCQGITDFFVGVGLEYRKDRWTFSGGYQVQADGKSGVTFGIRCNILEF